MRKNITGPNWDGVGGEMVLDKTLLARCLIGNSLFGVTLVGLWEVIGVWGILLWVGGVAHLNYVSVSDLLSEVSGDK